MLFPAKEIGLKFFQKRGVQKLVKGAEILGRDMDSLHKMPIDQVDWLLDSPPLSELEKKTLRNSIYGIIVGEIAFDLLLMDYNNLGPNLDDAMTLAYAEFEHSDLIKNPLFPVAQQSHENIWYKYNFKAVSHLWCVVRFLRDYQPGGIDLFEHPELLPNFLAISRFVQRLLVKIRPAHAKEPILKVEDLWYVPDDMELKIDTEKFRADVEKIFRQAAEQNKKWMEKTLKAG